MVRPPPNSDLDTANEVFVQRAYDLPRSVPPTPVVHVVDLGANVGYSVLWWLRAFPGAKVTAFEPHPIHCAQIRRHLDANDPMGRVTLVEAAAGVAAGTVYLSDAENQSTVIGTTTGIAVPVRDVFAEVKTPVSVMKIDIEGAEYDILADPRFAAMRPRVVVLEWHITADARSGPRWCSDRLTELGYTVTPTENHGQFGMTWGVSDG